MPNLVQSLQGKDLGHLRIIAQFWGMELNAPDVRRAIQAVSQFMLNRKYLSAVIEKLPANAQQAWNELREHEGRLAWAVFIRRYGALREMGAARRDREQPYLDRELASELLWYRGLIGRGYFDTARGPEEFAYIPEDILELLPAAGQRATAPPGRPASSAERATPLSASDWVIDHTTTLLAAFRSGLGLEAVGELEFPGSQLVDVPPLPATVLVDLLTEMGLIDLQQVLASEPVREFLETPRGNALANLTQAWVNSLVVNDLFLLPGLVHEGEWKNEPRQARQSILDFFRQVPGEKWWSLGSFVEAIRLQAPDYQRPAGDYDSWFIRRPGSPDYLRGFEHWDEIDGALIRWIITGPLYWLGCVDLASPSESDSAERRPVTAFRRTGWAEALLAGEGPVFSAESEASSLRSDGRLRIPRLGGRAFRYQAARFVSWEGFGKEAYHYRLTPGALLRARQQGLRVSHLLALFRKGNVVVPPILLKALERWEEQGSQARLERLVVLRVSRPEILQELRATRSARFLGELLGSTAVIVKEGAGEKVLAALAELGYLGEAFFASANEA